MSKPLRNVNVSIQLNPEACKHIGEQLIALSKAGHCAKVGYNSLTESYDAVACTKNIDFLTKTKTGEVKKNPFMYVSVFSRDNGSVQEV